MVVNCTPHISFRMHLCGFDISSCAFGRIKTQILYQSILFDRFSQLRVSCASVSSCCNFFFNKNCFFLQQFDEILFFILSWR